MKTIKIGEEYFLSITASVSNDNTNRLLLDLISNNNLIFVKEKIKHIGGFFGSTVAEITFLVSEPKIFEINKKIVDILGEN